MSSPIKNKLSLFVILILVSFSLKLWANNSEASLNQLSNDLKLKNWEQARQELLKMRQVQPSNANVYYNLGNLAYQQGQMGWAAAYYQKAHFLNPRDEDTVNNLNLIQKKFKDDNSAFNNTWWDLCGQAFFWNQILGFSESAWLVLFFAAACALWTYWAWRKQELSNSLGVPLLYFILFFVLAGWGWQWQDFQSRGLLVVPQIEARSGMLVNHTVLFVLHEGAPVRILQKESNFYKIQFSAQQVGWVPASAIAELKRI